MALERNKNPRKNRYARAAKVSTYKTKQLVECFADDLPIGRAARLTRLSERTVRDRYADIRDKLLPWSLKHPACFNGLGYLLTDADGTLNPTLLEAMLWYGTSAPFRAYMAPRYPRFNPDYDPVLSHVIEKAARTFCAVELPEATPDFRVMMRQAFGAAQVEATIMRHRRHARYSRGRDVFWRAAARQLNEQADRYIRKSLGSGSDRFFRDLREMLRDDPL